MHAVAIKSMLVECSVETLVLEEVVKNKKMFNGYLDDMKQMVINEVVDEFLEEDVGYLHDKYIESSSFG